MKRQILPGVLILLFIASFATADVNVPDPCAAIVTIQDGIDAAVNGEVVFVADGVWKGLGNRDLDFGNGLPFGQTRAITVRSVNGPNNCIIDCNDMGRAFIFENFEDNNSVVEGFTIQNGSADYGGGIECDNSSPKISNCIITGNFASIYGGGVDLYMSSAVITNCKINNNNSNSDGGGINCDTDVGLPPTISFCEIIGNTTLYVGGGVNFYKSSAVVKNCLLKDNVASDVGGAVYLWDSGPEISNCTIVDNTGSDNFGGIYRETFTGLPTIKNSILWNNGDDLYNCLGLVSYSCVQDNDPGVGNRSGDPMFRDGPLGSYYLSQEDANQLADSPCVDAGIGLASDLVGPYSYTTRTDSIADACDVDMGYHYPDSGTAVNYQLTTSVGDANGSIEPNLPDPNDPNGSFVQFAEVALTADPCEGYEVQAWTGADNVPAAGEVNNVVTMDANKTVGVTFQAKPTYTLTFTAGANGEIIEPRRPGTYYKGTVVVLIVEPAPGYRVDEWTGADDFPGWNMNENTVTMTSNKTVTVTFELDYSNIIHVPGDYPEIQLAIEAAADGDTIVISEGLYAGKGFHINKNITITGQTPEDPNLVVLDADLGVLAFKLFGAGGSGVCTISGLTMINFGGGSPDAPDGQDPNDDGADGYGGPGAAVLVFGNHVISNCVIRNAFNVGGLAGDGADGSTSETYEIPDPEDPDGTISVPDFGARFAGNGGDGGDAYGAGIYIESGNPLIINTIVENCTVIAGNAGDGGDGVSEPADPEQFDSNFPASPGGDGGVPGLARGAGVYSEPGTWPTFENCIIRNNVAVGGAGGDGGDAGDVNAPALHGPPGGFGGLTSKDPSQPDPWTRSALGAGVYVGGKATFTNCRFTNNQTYGAHSGIGGDHSIAHYQQPRRNYHIPSFGAGVYCPNSTNTTFTNCTFEDNETVYGGYPGPYAPPDVTVYDIDGPTGFGAAISIGETAGGTAHSVIIDCNFAENTSDFGGAFYGVNSDLRFEDCNFISNLGASGGAMATTGESIAEISGSIFRGNVATYAPGPNQVAGTGGGLFCMETELLASDCIFTGNLAYNSGGGVYLGGDLETGNPVLNNCLITDNTAGRTGGGVACDWFVSPIISNCTIAGNATEVDPSYGGGLFCTMSSFPRVIDSIIWGNVSINGNGGEIAVTNGDLGFPLPSRLDITYSDIGPRYAYLDFNSDDPFVGGGGGGTTLVDGQSIYEQFDAGQDKVKVIVSLFEPVEMKEATDWESPESVSVLRAEIASRQSAVLSTLTPAEFTLRHLYENQTGFSGEVTVEGLNKLLGNPSVAYIEPVRYVQPALAQAIPLANALEARQVYDGTGIAVAIVDTGVDYTHPRLGNGGFPNAKVIGGYDTGNDDNDPMPVGEAHGTCCGGIAAGGLGTVGDYIGGVAYNAKIYALKLTTDDGLWPTDSALASWDWCITHRNDDPENPIKVMSNSWVIYGLPFDDPAEADALSPAMTAAADTAVAAGITIMAASGNDGFAGQGISWPSAMSKVISVGAVYDTTDAVTGYSNTADNLDILAPADPVYTTDIVGLGGYDPGDYYPYFNGTSSACPFAAGAVASLQSAALAETESYLTPAQLRNLLVVSGDPVTDTKVAITKPRVNLGVAINYLISGPIYVEEGSTLNGWDWNADSNNWDPNSNSNNIDEDPNFVKGYYLSQVAAGQDINSPCVDGGHTLASVLGMDAYTTRTDGFPDTYDPNNPDPNSVIVDMGYHYMYGATQHQLTLTVVDNNGTVEPNYPVPIASDPNSGIYSYYKADIVTLITDPCEGYRVKKWTGTDDDASVDPNNYVTMNSDKTVTVKFELIPTYQLTASVVGGNGTISPTSGTFYDDEVVLLTATPDPNYGVYAWNGTDNDSTRELTNTVTINDSNAHVTVEFGLIGEGDIFIERDPNIFFATIQDAIDAAVVPGDVVIIGNGTYTGVGNYDLHFNGIPITVRSENGPENCIIDCNGLGRGFRFSLDEDSIIRDANGVLDINSIPEPNYIVRGFTIANGSANFGGGLYYEGTVDGEGNLTANFPAPLVENCIIIGNSATTSGGGVAFNVIVGDPNAPEVPEDAPVPTITNCKIINNTTSLGYGANGGGIFCTGGIAPIITTTEVSHNSGYFGGGIYCEAGSAMEIINCLIIYNESVDIGGAIYLFESDAIINLSTIMYNTGLNYEENAYGFPIPIGGVACRDAGPTITNCIIGRSGSTNPDYGTWGDGITYGDDLYECEATFSCIENADEGEGNISDNPMFITGGLGVHDNRFYLPQLQSDQSIDSPCIDAGEQYALAILQGPPPDGYNLGFLTTSTINDIDIGFTDMGFHYPFYDGPKVEYNLKISVIGEGHLRYWVGTSDTEMPEDANFVYPTSPVDFNLVTGTVVQLMAVADDETLWGYWDGTEDDTSFDIRNEVFMSSGDRNVNLRFELIVHDKLYVPEEYPLLQSAIDAAKFGDIIILAPTGSDNPYRTSMGYVIQNKKAITITSEYPDDPACVAATVIEMQPSDVGGWVNTAFTFINVDNRTVLDGITIRGFNLDGVDGITPQIAGAPGTNGSSVYGGAILCQVNASPIIKNCIITDCSVTGGNGGNGADGTAQGGHGGWPGRGYGGGMACLYDSNPAVINCTFENSTAAGGNGGNGGDANPIGGKGGRGGAWFYGENSYWYNVTWPYAYHGYYPTFGLGDGFYDFYTKYTGRGGAVFVGEGCRPTFTDCTFTNNQTEGGTCGICGLDQPAGQREQPGLSWEIDNFGGAVYCDANSLVIFENCTFNDNIADTNKPTLDPNDPDSYDNDDSFVGFGGAVAFKDADVTFDNCTFNGNLGDIGGAMYWAYSDPLISDCNFTLNSASSGGGILFVGGSGIIFRSDFSENEATGQFAHGGGICSLGSNAGIFDCNISNNDASGSGGGIYISSKDIDGSELGWSSLMVENCLIVENSADRDGGGISANWGSEPNIFNCTIADNTVTGVGYGGGVYGSYGSYTNIVDSIIWGNSAYYGPQIGIGITVSPSTVEVSDSDVQGAQSDAYVEDDCTLIWNPNNLYADPLFVIGPLGDYYLSQIGVDDPNQTVDSPCVDAGSGSAISVGMSGYTTRTDELFDRGIVDMGYHHLITLEVEECRVVDLFLDHFINFKDYAVFAPNWLRDDCSADNGWCDGADFTFDGNVDFEDLEFYIGCSLVVDNDTPAPNPSEWAIEPYSSSATSISMAAKTTVDTWGGNVEYYFECVYGDCNDSGWQSDPCYTDDAKGFGLDPNTEYGYRVRAKDSRCGDIGDLNCTFDPNDPNDPNAPNRTGWSDIRYAITGEEEEPLPDTTPPSPAPVISSYTATSSSITLSATTATDPEDNGVQYYFEDVNAPAVNSTWIANPTWTDDVNLAADTMYTYRVKARDESLLYNETEWSPLFDATTLAEGEEPNEPNEPNEPPLQAPVIVSANQVEVGVYWHHIITAEATAEDPLYFRFVCLEQSIYNSAWVPRDGNAVDTFAHPVVPPDFWPDTTITRGSGVITYDIVIGTSWNLWWEWKVCGSNNPSGDDPLCSAPVAMPPPF